MKKKGIIPDWQENDKRSYRNRHWAGKHSKKCIKYLPEWFGQGCSYTHQLLGLTDLDKLRIHTVN